MKGPTALVGPVLVEANGQLALWGEDCSTSQLETYDHDHSFPPPFSFPSVLSAFKDKEKPSKMFEKSALEVMTERTQLTSNPKPQPP